MLSGLTSAGGSAVAKTAVGYRPTEELIRHAGDDIQTTSPWSKQKRNTKVTTTTGRQPLVGNGSSHSNPSTSRVRTTTTTTTTSSTTTSKKSMKQQAQSATKPPDRKLSTPPRRRLDAKDKGVMSPGKKRQSLSPIRKRVSPAKQRPPSVVISTNSKSSPEEEDLTSLGASLHSKQSHCLVGVPKKTSQSLRLLRVLLNQPTLLTVSKLYVNQAIQKHMHLLKELQSTRQSNQILETQLEIAKTDADIARAASASAEQRLKAVKWKLAKERQMSKDKLSAAAASMAMSSSIVPTSNSNANLADVVALVEKTILSLRAKEKVLSELNENVDNDETTAMVEQLELESKLLRQHLDKDGRNAEDDSDSTPVMGHQSFSSSEASKVLEEIGADQTSWPKEKRQMKRDFEETIASAERKIDQLKSVLAVCNERRVRAEQFLDKDQKEALIQFTVENQEQLAHNTLQPRSSYGSDVVVEKFTIVDDVEDDLESSRLVMATEVPDLNNEELNIEMDSMKNKLEQLERDAATMQGEREVLKTELQSAKDEASQYKIKILHLEATLEETQNKIFDLILIGKEQIIDEKQISIENLKDELVQVTKRLQETKQELDASKETLNSLRTEPSRLHGNKQHCKKINDSRNAVRQAEAKVGEIRARMVRPYHSADSPGKVRSQIAALERRSSDVSPSEHTDRDEGLGEVSFDNVSLLEVRDFSDNSVVVHDEIPTEAEMATNLETIATISEDFTNAQSKINTLKDTESSFPPAPVIELASEQGAESTNKDIELIELKRQLEAKSQKLNDAEQKLALFEEEAHTDSPTKFSQEEMNGLRQKLLSANKELNEANGKLSFLRKVVLSVVPWEDDEENEENSDYEEV